MCVRARCDYAVLCAIWGDKRLAGNYGEVNNNARRVVDEFCDHIKCLHCCDYYVYNGMRLQKEVKIYFS